MVKKSLAIGIIFFLVISSVPYSTMSNEISTSTLGGNTLYVGGTGPGNHSKIQDAIDNASNSDTVFVYSGTYYENVVLAKSINLIGEDKYTTIIDGKNAGNVVLVKTNNVSISEFTIQNGGSSGMNGGIYLNSASNNHITGNTISDNSGRGIYLDRSSKDNIITVNTISDNSVYGIQLWWSCNNNVIKGNIISNNGGEGLFIHRESNNNNITGNTISNNQGSGIWLCHSSHNNITANIISNTNNSYWGGICFFYKSNNNDIKGNIVSNNDGDGIVAFVSSSNNNIDGNIISNNDGDGIQIYNHSNGNSIDGNIISNNIDNGISISLLSENNLIYQNDFMDNGRNACDTYNNAWDNKKKGNYWDDYETQYPNAKPLNGIWDTPYDIPRGNNQDKHPLVNPWSGKNRPPNTPSIMGPTSGKARSKYEYSFSTTDPDGHNVLYYIDWGDNTNSGWIGLYLSGEEVTKTHTWQSKGTYRIQMKSKDIYDAESDWATLEVSMPKNKAISTPFFSILENHPHLFPILRHLLEL